MEQNGASAREWDVVTYVLPDSIDMQQNKRHKSFHKQDAKEKHANGVANGSSSTSLRSAQQSLPIWKAKDQLITELKVGPALMPAQQR